MQKALVSVTGQDRVGIIAKVSTSLCEQNINILEISQTIMDGCFTMLMVVDIESARRKLAAAVISRAVPDKDDDVLVDDLDTDEDLLAAGVTDDADLDDDLLEDDADDNVSLDDLADVAGDEE